MADPICRWRNPYIKTVREFIAELPKAEMPSVDFRRIMETSSYGSDFFRTPYQLACQLGLYYENNGIYYPRFKKNAGIKEVKLYLKNWLEKYPVPNPYTKQGFELINPIGVHSELCRIVYENENSLDWHEIKLSLFNEEIGNDDILVNTINTYSDALQIKNSKLQLKEAVVLADLEEYIFKTSLADRNDKKSFFDLFSKEAKSILKSNNTIRTVYGADHEVLNHKNFISAIRDVGLSFSDTQTTRFTASLLTKPFVILSGLSGSGKTKLAQAFAIWICENENQYCIVPVGADWTNREPLLGYPNALKNSEYVKPDNRALDLIIEANKDENSDKPYFLILDEMNLSHVERYFADFLSTMESKDKISLHSGEDEWNGVPAKIGFPKNLFIIGTVNVDETTYMFSPKVLDRANVIEFSVTAQEMEGFLLANTIVKLENLRGLGAAMAGSFLAIAKDETLKAAETSVLNNALMSFFSELKKTGSEFGYRSATEILRFAGVINKIEPEWSMNNIIDAAIMQKLLPKVHGSRRKLEPVLKTLGNLCLGDEKKFEDYFKSIAKTDDPDKWEKKYPVSLEKIVRMYHNLISNGFTSYAEA